MRACAITRRWRTAGELANGWRRCRADAPVAVAISQSRAKASLPTCDAIGLACAVRRGARRHCGEPGAALKPWLEDAGAAQRSRAT